MSNEKPVRITVGDVKEVTEATTIRADTHVSNVAQRAPATVDGSGNGMVMLAGLAGVVLFIIAGYFGIGNGASAAANNTPPASNMPAANNAPANAVNGPADKALTPDTKAAKNAPAASGNVPAANNAPAASNNAPAANNASK